MRFFLNNISFVRRLIIICLIAIIIILLVVSRCSTNKSKTFGCIQTLEII